MIEKAKKEMCMKLEDTPRIWSEWRRTEEAEASTGLGGEYSRSRKGRTASVEL